MSVNDEYRVPGDADLTRQALVWTIKTYGPIRRAELLKMCYVTSKQARLLRDDIQTLRSKGYPIANNGKGYFLAATEKELVEGTKRERRQAYTMLKTISKQLRISIPKLVGQMELEFGEQELEL